MNKHTKIFLAIILLGALSVLGIKFLQPGWIEKQLKSTSDAINTKGTIHIGVDNWIGYFPLCSPKMEDKLRKLGYLLRCEDDQADYASRFQKLKDGDLVMEDIDFPWRFVLTDSIDQVQEISDSITINLDIAQKLKLNITPIYFGDPLGQFCN